MKAGQIELRRKPTLQAKKALKITGYRVVYHGDRVNHCPACGRSQWHVGRSTAECAFCATAIPLAAPVGGGS